MFHKIIYIKETIGIKKLGTENFIAGLGLKHYAHENDVSFLKH